MQEIVVTVVALAVIIAYTLILKRHKPLEVWTWASGLLATLVSVALGIAVALTLFKYTNAQQDATNKVRFQQLLKAEMSDTYRILSAGEAMNVNFGESTQRVHVAYIQPLSIEEAAKSGLFDVVATENLMLLARTMRMYNIKCQYFLTALSAGHSREVVRHAGANVEETRQAVLNDITLMTMKLHLELSPSINSK
jgi:hypothetical protein